MRDRRRRGPPKLLQARDADAERRRARVARWLTRRPVLDGLADCEAAVVRAELARASHLDDTPRIRLWELIRELMQVEQFGRVAILAALLPTGRHDA
jgi:hypothetical protein